MTYRVGACATPSAGKAMAEYYLAGTLKTEQTRAAEYYTGAEARDERAADFWHDAVREGHLAAGGTVAELRPDLSPAFAARLGIANPDHPLTQAGIANLLNATRVDGRAIAGRKQHSATRSVAEIFALDPKQPASAEAIPNVLAGRRADGGMPQTVAGKALPAAIVEGARKRYKAALGVPSHREATAEEIAHLENGRLANGRLIDMADYRRQIHATRPPVGFVDMTFSADKSLSVAWALAPTEAERSALVDIHRHAVAATMAYAETHLGVALKRTGCTAMQSGVGSANSRVLQYHRQCVEHLLLRSGVRDSCFQTQGWFINKQQHRQARSFQALNLPADDLRNMKCDGCKKGGGP